MWAKEIESDGGKVLYIKVKQMAPKDSSMLICVEVYGEPEFAFNHLQVTFCLLGEEEHPGL